MAKLPLALIFKLLIAILEILASIFGGKSAKAKVHNYFNKI